MHEWHAYPTHWGSPSWGTLPFGGQGGGVNPGPQDIYIYSRMFVIYIYIYIWTHIAK